MTKREGEKFMVYDVKVVSINDVDSMVMKDDV